MGQPALNSLLDNLASTAAPVIHARVGGAWDRGDREFGRDVRALAAALIGYGLRPGARAAVLGSDGPDTVRAQLAVLVAGATLVSVPPSLENVAIARALASSGAVQAIASDEAQLARLLELRPELPNLELVLLMRAQPSERKTAALLASAAIQVGTAALAAEPTLLKDALSSGEPSDALINFGADSRGLTVARATLVELAKRVATTIETGSGRAVVVALPAGSVVGLAAAMAVAAGGGTLLLAGDDDRPDAGLQQLKPHAMLLSVAALRRLHQAWEQEIERRSWLGRAVARWSIRRGSDPATKRWKRRLADSLTLRELRSRLGGELARLDVVRAGTRDNDVAANTFFESVGIPVRHFMLDAASPGLTIAPP